MTALQFAPFWQADAPKFNGGVDRLQGQYDVAVIGAGFTGLGAARKLAKDGAKVAVLEANTVGSGASGRNGGHLNNGLAHSFVDACNRVGQDRAIAMYRAFDAGIDTIEQIISEDQIACDFRRSGKLKLASRAQHMAGITRNFEAINTLVDPDTALLSKDDLRAEIGSNMFYGAMLQRKSAMMHMGKFATGLAQAAARYGADILEGAAVTACTPDPKGHLLSTAQATITARKVLLATGAYTTPHFPWFRKRLIPVGSYLIATRPLSTAEIAATLPGGRTYVTSLNLGNYFRLSPDNRLIFGGRARLSNRSDPRADAKSGVILRAAMVEMFPHLAQVNIDYCWGGMVDMTQDRYPRAGQVDGLYYAMGYSGHGAQIATHLGEIIADQMTGQTRENPFAALPWPAVPGHLGMGWVLPLVGAYYKVLDQIR
ncbi:MAG: NAD(P)/FAD-dependent oxidoreductase [Sedimentitalea sp.]